MFFCAAPNYETLKTASQAFVAGSFIKYVDRELECADCISLLNAPQSDGILHSLIKSTDAGGLHYPTRDYISNFVTLQVGVK